MKIVLQSVRTGRVSVTEAPAPQVGAGQVLVQTAASLISAGTERMVMEFAKKNLLDKARARPDLVRQVADKAQREGILTTLDAVRSRLDEPLALGYSSAGTVLALGEGITNFQVGDRVACAGGGHAVHAEIVSVPAQLVVPIPEPLGSSAALSRTAGGAREDGDLQSARREPVTADEAAFTTIGAVALQGVRLADAKLAEVVAVIGLGLLGQLTVQLLKAAGCVVVGMDLQAARAAQARRLGADAVATGPDEMSALVERLTGGHGADAVLITADTPSSEPVTLAGEVARDRAVVVAVGAVGLEIPRKVYYEKELDFRVSRSYGPGRYDLAYEEKGHDYPIGYVRWTENRNMQAFLQLLASGQVDVRPLISHRFPIDAAPKAYELVTGKTGEPFLGVLIHYADQPDSAQRVDLGPAASFPVATAPQAAPSVAVGLLGAGNFARVTLLPAMRKVPGIVLCGVCTATGLSARYVGDRFGFHYCATDEAEILADPGINTVVIATRHDLHARQAVAAMRAGKDVFVEKPLALDRLELVEVLRVQHQLGRRLMVGFNRRFAPMVQEMQRFLARRTRPVVAVYRVNAGAIPPAHWTQDRAVGGGRIIGEACHFLDLLQFLIGAPALQVSTEPVRTEQGKVEDEVVITARLADGSIGTVIYTAGGDKGYSKERIEVFGDGRAAVLDDYRELELLHQGRRRRHHERLRSDKGHVGEWRAFSAAVTRGAPTPISVREIAATHLCTFAALESFETARPVSVDLGTFWSEVQTT